MDPDLFRTIRQELGLSEYQIGRALGYEGTRQTIKTQIHRYEKGIRPIKPWIARLMLMYERHGIPVEFKPKD